MTRPTPLSEIIAVIPVCLVVVWTAAMFIPLWNLAAFAVSNFPFGPFYPMADAVFVWSIFMTLLVTVDYVVVEHYVRRVVVK